MKITREINLDLEDAASNPLDCLMGCEGEVVFMKKEELIQFLQHPLVVGAVPKFKVTIGKLNISVGEI